MAETNNKVADDALVSDEAIKKAEQYIEEEEGAINRLPGRLGAMVTVLAVITSLFHLYAAYGIMPTHVLRGIDLAIRLGIDPRKARRLARRIHQHALARGLPRIVCSSSLMRCRAVGRHLRRLGWQHRVDEIGRAHV